METKRCQRCHKLLRFDAQQCSRCGGQDFMPVGATKSRLTVKLPYREDEAAFPSNPPASPHRVGHYSGLHPEDQPYQSGFLPVQRPPTIYPSTIVDEPEVGTLKSSSTWEESYDPHPARRHVATFTPLPQLRQQRGAPVYAPPLDEQTYQPAAVDASPEVADDDALLASIAPTPPTLPMREPEPLKLGRAPRRNVHRGGIIPILLVFSCFLFLIATSILTFLLLNNKSAPAALSPELFAEPSSHLRAGDLLIISGTRFAPYDQLWFTHDNNIPIDDPQGKQLEVSAYSTGNFAVQLTIPADWSPGPHTIYASDRQHLVESATIKIEEPPPPSTPPALQLPVTHIDAKAGNIGAITTEQVELINTGAGKVFWKASSDASWLSANPPSGSFGGSEVVNITVNRGTLVSQAYTGHLTFTQLNSPHSTTPLILTVTMSVNPAPPTVTAPNLVLTSAALTFSGTPVRNPLAQTLTLENSGGQALNWTASIATTGGGNWLAVSPGGGTLLPSGHTTINVSANSTGLSAGTYSGTLLFSYGSSSATATITLTVSLPPAPELSVQPGSGLTFNAYQGQNAVPQSFTINNPGNAPLNWGITEDANGLAYAPVSAKNGTLLAGQSATVRVTPSITQLKASTVNALITISDTDKGTTIKSQQIPVTFIIVNQAGVGVNTNQMQFNHTSAIQISTQTITLTDVGSLQLNWGVTITNTSPVQWLSVDNLSGSLGPSTVAYINVTSDSTHLSPGTFTASIQIYDTDTGTPVSPQTITITLIVS